MKEAILLALAEGPGLILVTGPTGHGKTTAIEQVLMSPIPGVLETSCSWATSVVMLKMHDVPSTRPLAGRDRRPTHQPCRRSIRPAHRHARNGRSGPRSSKACQRSTYSSMRSIACSTSSLSLSPQPGRARVIHTRKTDVFKVKILDALQRLVRLQLTTLVGS